MIQMSLFRKKNLYSRESFAQEGEDLVIERLLGNKENGFYIDIGAHHPQRFSNTYFFYKKGWRGINIDPMPNSMTLFNQQRPNDLNLEIGVSKEEKELTYFIFNEPALNTFSESEAERKNGYRSYRIIEEKLIKTYPLTQIFDKHLRSNQAIDFMSIDVEGLDLEVIESNNWEKYRPKLLIVEELIQYPMIDLPLNSLLFQSIVLKDYGLVAKTLNTLFFKDLRC